MRGRGIGWGAHRRLALTKEAQHSKPRWLRTFVHYDGRRVGLRYAEARPTRLPGPNAIQGRCQAGAIGRIPLEQQPGHAGRVGLAG